MVAADDGTAGVGDFASSAADEQSLAMHWTPRPIVRTGNPTDSTLLIAVAGCHRYPGNPPPSLTVSSAARLSTLPELLLALTLKSWPLSSG